MTDRNRCTAIIAAELERELARPAAYAAAVRIVAALDAAAEAAGTPYYAEGDIVQLSEGALAGILLVVKEATPEGLEAYRPGRHDGLVSFHRLNELTHTGGRSSYPHRSAWREAADGVR